MAFYRPKLKYLFCVANYRSLWPQLSLMKYLNALGIEPYYIMQDTGMLIYGEKYIPILAELKMKRVPSPEQLPDDYDVMFTQSVGLDGYENACLVNSWAKGKINIKLHNSMSTYNRIVNVNYTPDRVRGHIHGICMKEQRAVDHYRLFLSDTDSWMLNVGDPDWDYFQTEEFKTAVSDTKKKYGDKTVLICASFDSGKVEANFWTAVIPWMVAKGFCVLIRPHPGCEKHIPLHLQKYASPNLHRHVLFAAASHVIAEMASSVVGESMLLKTKVGGYPFVPHTPKYGRHSWMDNDMTWRESMAKQVGARMLASVPFIHNKSSVDEFLADSTPCVTDQQADELWGWPKVPCYCEHLFKCVEEKLGR